MVQINRLVQKYTPEIPKQVCEVVSEPKSEGLIEVSKVASECVSNVQKGLIEAKKSFPKLNRYSNACDYFGADSAKHIQWRWDNQMALSWLKTRDQNLVHFPPITLSGEPDVRGITKSLKRLKENGFGRLTITDKLFGDSVNKEGTHTIGLVHHQGKYIILDSIPETYPELKDCHERLVKFLGLNPKDVIFSNKPQQSFEEYTCNNWTHANLDAVIEYMKNGGKDKELTPEVLDKILPEDINRVLGQQFIYTFNELKGRDLSEIVIESYNRRHKAANL